MELKNSLNNSYGGHALYIVSKVQIISYLTKAVLADNEATSNFKLLDESSVQLLKGGYVQNIRTIKGRF